MSKKYAAILLRSRMHANKNTLDTLESLNLRKKHICVLVDEVNKGMLVAAKDFITYGEVTPETVKLLLEKRGAKDAQGKPKRFFALAPPRGGFERKGIKQQFNNGGALGNRGLAINDLIKKMI